MFAPSVRLRFHCLHNRLSCAPNLPFACPGAIDAACIRAHALVKSLKETPMEHDYARLMEEYKTMHRFHRGLCHNTLVVQPDDATRIKYNANAKPGDEDFLFLESLSRSNEPVVAIQGRIRLYPIPIGDFSIGYYEVTFLAAGEDAAVGIGVALKNFPHSMPGWELDSYGYHADDAGFFNQLGTAAARTVIGEPWKLGETVGFGLNFATKEIFLTRNGELLAVPATNVSLMYSLFPTVGFHTQGAVVRVNLGAEPFMFDLVEYQLHVREKKALDGATVPEWESFTAVLAEAKRQRKRDSGLSEDYFKSEKYEELTQNARLFDSPDDYAIDKTRRFFYKQLRWLQSDALNELLTGENEDEKKKAIALERLTELANMFNIEVDNNTPPANLSNRNELLRRVERTLLGVFVDYLDRRRQYLEGNLEIQTLHDEAYKKKFTPEVERFVNFLLLINDTFDVPVTSTLMRALLFQGDQIFGMNHAESDSEDDLQQTRLRYLRLIFIQIVVDLDRQDEETAIKKYQRMLADEDDYLFQFDQESVTNLITSNRSANGMQGREEAERALVSRFSGLPEGELQWLIDHLGRFDARDCANICAVLLDGSERVDSQIMSHVFIETLIHVNALVPQSMRLPLSLWKRPEELRVQALKLWVFIRNSDFLLATINGLAVLISLCQSVLEGVFRLDEELHPMEGVDEVDAEQSMHVQQMMMEELTMAAEGQRTARLPPGAVSGFMKHLWSMRAKGGVLFMANDDVENKNEGEEENELTEEEEAKLKEEKYAKELERGLGRVPTLAEIELMRNELKRKRELFLALIVPDLTHYHFPDHLEEIIKLRVPNLLALTVDGVMGVTNPVIHLLAGDDRERVRALCPRRVAEVERLERLYESIVQFAVKFQQKLEEGDGDETGEEAAAEGIEEAAEGTQSVTGDDVESKSSPQED